MAEKVVLAIDIGGSLTKIGLVDKAGEVLEKRETGKGGSALRVLAKLNEYQSIITKQGSSYRRTFNH